MAPSNRRARAFESVAAAYDRYRPPYPHEVGQVVLDVAGVSRPRVLEVGAGTGLATEVLASAGCSAIALEPGAELARQARRRLAGTDVDVQQYDFEHWPGGEPFDIVFAADAWHWVDPAVRLRRARDHLRPSGALVLAWHQAAGFAPPATEFLAEVYRHHTPELPRPGARPSALHRESVEEIEQCSWFDLPRTHRYRISRTLSADEFVGLVSTYSDHALLDDSPRCALFIALRHVIDHKLAGYVEKFDDVLLVLARRVL